MNIFDFKASLDSFSSFIFYNTDKGHVIDKCYEMLCQNPQYSSTCTCPSCINKSEHFDIVIVDSEKSVSIEDIREIKNLFNIKPRFKYKFIIINKADSLSNTAANSLLKVLEEAPSYLKFILITKNDVLPTIQSRSVIVRFDRLSNEELSKITGITDMDILNLMGGEVLNYSKDVFEFNILKAEELVYSTITPIVYASTLNTDDFDYNIFRRAFFNKLLVNENYSQFFSIILLNLIKEFDILGSQLDMNLNKAMCLDGFVYRVDNVMTQLRGIQ